MGTPKAGEIRVIQVRREAVLEWLVDSINEHAPELFGLNRLKELDMEWDAASGTLTCIARVPDGDETPDLNLDAVRAKAGITAESLWDKPCYRTLNYLEDPSLMEF